MGGPAGDPDVIGRDNELDMARRGLADGNVLLLGEPGIGKTTVWRALVDELLASGQGVLVASPAEAEHDFSYAVLSDLVDPLKEDIGTLPIPQRRALEHALLVADDEGSADPHLVSVAVRTLLRGRAESNRVVIAVDDVQWADQASLGALSFVLRRTPGVTLLATSRPGQHATLPVDAGRIELVGLSLGATHHMIVQQCGYSLSRPTLLRLHEVSGGNPFFALELARVTGRDGDVVLPESLRSLLANRLAVLQPETQRALAKAALGGAWADDLGSAVDAGLVAPGRPCRFVHPLYAEAAIGQTNEAVRRELHREIADETESPVQRARHLALSTSGTNDDVAMALETAARESVRRGALLAAAHLWQSAAELTTADDGLRRAERLVESGIALLLAGSPDEGDAVLAANVPMLPPGALRHRALIHRALMLARTDSRAVIPVLEDVYDEVLDPNVRHEVVALISAFEMTVGNGERASRIVDEHLAWAEQNAREMLPAALLLAASRRTGDDQPGWDLIERARAAAAAGSKGPQPAWGWASRPPALLREDRWDEARATIEEADRDDPAATVYQEASRSIALAMIELAAGDAESARARADEVLCIGEQIMAPYLICQGHIATAEAALLLGDLDAAQTGIHAALTVAERVHAQLYADSARHTLGLLHLSTGNVQSAAAAFDATSEDSFHHYNAVAGGRMQVDAVEAFTSVGSVERARWVAATIPTDAWEHDVATAMLQAADGELEQALATVRASRRPYAPYRQARNLLLEGRWLRMLRQRTAARTALESARDLFASVTAPLWVARAEDELARLGGRRSAGTVLTESERCVAELVAAGLSNKEVAARLIVSQRTVEVHLTKIYAKLDVPGRTALVARWPVA